MEWVGWMGWMGGLEGWMAELPQDGMARNIQQSTVRAPAKLCESRGAAFKSTALAEWE
jgi:hypothetical protein